MDHRHSMERGKIMINLFVHFKGCCLDFRDASLRLIVGPVIVIIVVIILDVSKTSQNNQSRWFKKIITSMVMLTP